MRLEVPQTGMPEAEMRTGVREPQLQTSGRMLLVLDWNCRVRPKSTHLQGD